MIPAVPYGWPEASGGVGGSCRMGDSLGADPASRRPVARTDADDEWRVAERRYFSAASMTKVDEVEGGEDPKEVLAQMA